MTKNSSRPSLAAPSYDALRNVVNAQLGALFDVQVLLRAIIKLAEDGTAPSADDAVDYAEDIHRLGQLTKAHVDDVIEAFDPYC